MQKTTKKPGEIADFAEHRGFGAKSRNLWHPWNRDFLEGQRSASMIFMTKPRLESPMASPLRLPALRSTRPLKVETVSFSEMELIQVSRAFSKRTLLKFWSDVLWVKNESGTQFLIRRTNAI